MFGIFTESAQKILVNAKYEMKTMNHSSVCTYHVLLGILNENNNLTRILNKHNLNYKRFKDELSRLTIKTKNQSNWFNYSDTLKKILEDLVLSSKENGEEINEEKIFISIVNESDGLTYQLLNYLNIDISSILNEINKKKKRNIKKSLVEELGDNLNRKAKNNKLDPVIGREKEIDRLIEILSRKNKNNPILVGSAGVGKTALVEELSRRIENSNVPKNLINKKIISLDLASIVSGTKYRGEFEEKLKKIINEVIENDNIILFIDEIHTIVGAGSGEGAIDASNILKPYLARNSIKVIGATTIEEYKKYIEKDKALERRFQKLIVEEPDKVNLKNILMKVKTVYENYHSVKISAEIIDEIIKLSDLYLYDRCEPDRSIDILDEVSSRVSLKELKEEKKLIKLEENLKKIQEEKNLLIKKSKYETACELKEQELKLKNKIFDLKSIINIKQSKKIVTKDDVINLVSSKSNIPIFKFKNLNEVETIKNKLKKDVINQDKAIDTLIEITKKIKLNLKNKNKSYSILFTGTSGVGKTYLAKKYGEYLTDNVIRIDMNEYTTLESVNKLIGSPSGYVGYDDNKNIFEQVRNKPFSVLILDEIEKANKKVINLFLNILDEGYCVDNRGNKIRFDNVVIIMTSNAKVKINKVGFNKNFKNSLIAYFPKEFINRVDEIIEFNDFSYNDAKDLVYKELKKYKHLNLSDSEIDSLIEESNYKEYGVRNLVRLIRKESDKKIIYETS